MKKKENVKKCICKNKCKIQKKNKTKKNKFELM